MEQNIRSKILVIALLIVVLQVALTLISGVVSERTAHKYTAQSSIIQAWAGPQQIVGPLVRIPYVTKHSKQTFNKVLNTTEVEEIRKDRVAYLLPEKLEISSATKTERRYRGIYEFPVHTTNVVLKGSFRVNEPLKGKSTGVILTDSPAQLEVGIGDIKGIAETMEVKINGVPRKVTPGISGNFTVSGAHTTLPDINPLANQEFSFEITLKVKGMNSFQVAALGESNRIAMTADWPHPKFFGNFLPESRSITDASFEAIWALTHFATDAAQDVKKCESEGCSFDRQLVGFELFEPVDLYVQTNRSIKYGLLFITMSFASFFIFEVLKSLKIHPMQYAFVGLMQAVFYLLLLSVSEHLQFFWAYSIATMACVAMLAFYLSAVLGSRSRGIGYGAGFAVLYAILYFLLQSEDYALLLGSLLLFVTLSAAMTLTRRLDWYAVQSPKKAIPQAS